MENNDGVLNDGNNKEQNVDIDALLQKARAEEKEKLYPTIEKLKGEIKSKTDRLNELILSKNTFEETIVAKDKEIEKLNGMIEKAKQEGKNLANEDLKLVEKERDVIQEKYDNLLKEFEDYKNKQEVDSYKATKLSELDEDFRDLVVGDTKEAIDASLEKAKALQEKLKEKYQKGLPMPTPKQKKEPPAKDDYSDIAGMTAEEYAEWRKGNSFIGGTTHRR